MSQTFIWACNGQNVTRVSSTGGTQQGDGGSHRLYAGRQGSYDYTSWLRFTSFTWAGVGRIVSATLVVYTDDQNGIMPPPGTKDVPHVWFNRVTSTFGTGVNGDGVFDAGDYHPGAYTNVNYKSHDMAKAAGFVNRIDVTKQVDQWAPRSVIRSDGTTGKGTTLHQISLHSSKDPSQAWSGWSQAHTDSLLRPTIEVVYELGPTVPNFPSNLNDLDPVASIDSFQADFVDIRATDTLYSSEVEVYSAAVTNTGQTINLNGGVRVWSRKQIASAAEKSGARSAVTPNSLTIPVLTTFKWRIRQTDQEGQTSNWTSLVTLQITNTNPVAPTLTPASGASYPSLVGVTFTGGTFSDADGDGLLAYQVELSALSSPADARWDDPSFILWETGKTFVASGDTSWHVPYGGAGLAAGTYYWRARHWDNRGGASDWTYATIILSADFNPLPGTQTAVQIDPHAPWRIVIRDMFQADGVTRTTGRGPGNVVAILENAKATGFSVMYNSPGELHFTLPVDHPQVSVIEPKQTHYSVQFYSGDSWQEKTAGLIWDYDATETSVIFYGIDYLALFDTQFDERFDPSNPDLPYTAGGSKYVDKTITQVITDQLTRAIGNTNSPVGFLTLGPIATMSEKVTIWSTMQGTLNFVTGLIQSHRQGTGKRTRIKVIPTTGGGYNVTIVDDPGTTKDDIRMKYGELVQGYRVIPFGTNWASTQHTIGRSREGLRVLYKSEPAPGIDQAIWGNIGQVQVMDDVSDENDLIRRNKQAAIHAGKLGSQIALAIRSGILQPLRGYDLCDSIPVTIQHGVVDTTRFGSGYWTIFGLAWEAEDNGATNTILTIMPREDTTSPDPDLIPTVPISPQPEWQIGWVSPDVIQPTSRYYLDQQTGIAYYRDESSGVVVYIPLIQANAPTNPNNSDVQNPGFAIGVQTLSPMVIDSTYDPISQTPYLPFWTLWATGTPNCEVTHVVSAGGWGGAVVIDPIAAGDYHVNLTSFPFRVLPGVRYTTALNLSWHMDAGSVIDITQKIEFFDRDDTPIGSSNATTTLASGTHFGGADEIIYGAPAGIANPVGGQYARITVTVHRVSGTDSADEVGLNSFAMFPVAQSAQLSSVVPYQAASLDAAGGLINVTNQTRIYPSASKVLKVDDGAGGVANLSVVGSVSSGTLLTSIQGISGGSATFPGSPSTHDRYWRTDLKMWFFYDGTRWLSVELYEHILGPYNSMSATTTFVPMFLLPRPATNLIRVEASQVLYAVAGGGTALSGSHKWVVQINYTPADAIMAVHTIDSGASGGTIRRDESTATVISVPTGTMYGYGFATKTGTPGDLTVYGFSLAYRIVG